MYVPPHRVTNFDLARVIDTSDQWIRERSGVVERRYVEEGVAASDLGARAASAAIEDAGLSVEDVDYIVCATMTPDHYFPGCGTIIQEKLGMPSVPALDIRQQCAGFAYGLQMVDALIRSGIAKTVLLVGADVHSALMPFGELSWSAIRGETSEIPRSEFEHNTKFRGLLVLFGDGAGAMVFQGEDEERRGIIGSRLYGDGKQRDILIMPGVGTAQRPYVSKEMIDRDEAFPVMDGRKVFKLAVTRMPKVTRQVLEDQQLSLEDLDLLVMHQANLRINEAAQKFLKLDDNRVFNNIQNYGNTTSATLPMAFHEAKLAGQAPEGSLVAFTALGAGLHWGSVLVRV